MRALLRPGIGFLCLAAFLLPGCGDQYAGRKAVSGKVTIKGEALKAGSIQFVPLENQGTQSGAGIKDGVYEIDRKGGLKPGKYLVRITAGDGVTLYNPPEAEAAGPGGNTNIVSFDIIPDDYGSNSKQQIEVTDSGDNKFDFAIPNAKTPPAKRAKR